MKVKDKIVEIIRNRYWESSSGVEQIADEIIQLFNTSFEVEIQCPQCGSQPNVTCSLCKGTGKLIVKESKGE